METHSLFKKLMYVALCVVQIAILSCSDNDSFTTSKTATLSFSTDSVKLDTVFATVGSRTYDFWVYNRSASGLRIENVRLEKGNQTGFRVNVDGSYLDNSIGSVVNGLEVRQGDSLRVFVELTAPISHQQEPQVVEDKLLFTLESGVRQQVVLSGHSWDAIIVDSIVVNRDTLIESSTPIVVMKKMRIDSLATLTLRNTTLYFHDKAGIDVYGTLIADSAVLRGDRLDRMFSYLPYDRVSGQWRGVHFFPSSFDNIFMYCEIRNATDGIVCDSAEMLSDRQRLYMEGTTVHNCAGTGLTAYNSWVGMLRCQVSNTLGDCVVFYGGAAIIDHCTIVQFYPLSAQRGVALRFANFYKENQYPLLAMKMTNCIVTGYDDDVVMGQTLEGDTLTPFGYYFENSLLRTPALQDTVNCRNVIWESKDDSIQGAKHFRLVDEKNLMYDFHLDSLSTAKGMGCY